MSDNIQNPGSAIGEAIGAQLEDALNRYLTKFVNQFACRLVSKGPENTRTKKATKLLLYDPFGTAYNIDAVIANESMQPLILLEYKYIRSQKHNRDKGSWLCTAHQAIRRRYNSVRSSIAILAGSWSGPSLAMLESHDVSVFMIPFDVIVQLLDRYKIQFDWGEKDRNTAIHAWNTYSQLSQKAKSNIAERMVDVIRSALSKRIAAILDDQTKRELEKITLEIHTTLGEVKRFEFLSIDDAMNFLEDFSMDEVINHANSFTLFDKPNINDD